MQFLKGRQMTKMISAKECALCDVFSSSYEFRIPPYQRPYSWTIEQSGQLLTDLHDSFLKDDSGSYFIGSIVLIKEDEKLPLCDVVDGQQRLTTLTILFAAIINLFKNDENKRAFQEFIKQPKNIARNYDEKPRLNVRDKDKTIFDKYILNCDLENLEKLYIEEKQHSLKNIKANALKLLEQLESYFKTDDDLLKFAQFVVNNCYLVLVMTNSQDSAASIFSVLNNRGLDLLPTDILKADIIDKIASMEQELYTDKWEECEKNLSREVFSELFYYIRMIYAKSKASSNLLKEFRESVIKGQHPQNASQAKKLIDDIIIPYANALDTITTLNYKSDDSALVKYNKDINNSFRWLNRIDVSDWKPVALSFYVKHSTDTEYLAWFYKKLERLAAILFVTGATANERISRFAEVLKEIELKQDSHDNPLKSIELTPDEKKKALTLFNGDIYSSMIAFRRKYLMLRLDSFVGDASATYDMPIVSIEHVLPQSMNKDWKKDWNSVQHEKWCHKIANLILLSRRKNSQAQNYKFSLKKTKYFKTDDTCSFALTTQVCNENKWTIDVVKTRQKTLLNILKDKWEL